MPETILGFDYGERRIGVAVGQSLTGTATALETVTNPAGGINWQRLEALIAQWRPDALVVGIPLTEAGDEQPVTRAARSFAGKLANRVRLPVHHADERYTSLAAKARMKEKRQAGTVRRRARAKLDAVAAQLIVEQWIAQRTAAG